MTINQFKLYCINLVTKNEGKMLSEIFNQNKDNIVLTLEDIYFNDTYVDIFLQISSLSVLKIHSGDMFIWCGDTELGEWERLEEPEYEDLIWLLKDFILYYRKQSN